MDLSNAQWRKASRSGNTDCVEVAVMPGLVAVRDSKDLSGPVLTFDPQHWKSFVRHAGRH
ncbi:DUF397 domain-containing protein [Micromonospora antibiotica]|uniref:DUF397 domain-containing protein n=1 Tax=Micromonospora antibiotica TaxID=2807623 RepID=A0ABS3VDB6_9ACTN|nr:DUF397 domain-containing protein [Micromonospora antibiotica]MBO4163557.1 DUF397 domain-containing protein [Micromonospora antibiotica]